MNESGCCASRKNRLSDRLEYQYQTPNNATQEQARLQYATQIAQ